MPYLLKENPGMILRTLKDEIKAFVLNNGRNPESSDNPEKAIVSFKTDRGTSHKRFIELLDIIQGAYYDIYAEQAGVSNARSSEVLPLICQYLRIRQIYDKGRAGIPLNISIADPSKVGN